MYIIERAIFATGMGAVGGLVASLSGGPFWGQLIAFAVAFIGGWFTVAKSFADYLRSDKRA